MTHNLTRDKIMSLEAGRDIDGLIEERVMGEPIPPRGYYLPEYSTDMEYAWRVVEHFMSKHIPFFIEYSNDKVPWFALFGDNIDNYAVVGEEGSGGAPLAICRAALLITLEKPDA